MSRTFVPVDPVVIASPSAMKNEYESLRLRKSLASSPRAFARWIVVLSMIAPAAGLLPSMPSVPAQTATVSDEMLFSDLASRKAESRLRTPIMLPWIGHANLLSDTTQTAEMFCIEESLGLDGCA